MTQAKLSGDKSLGRDQQRREHQRKTQKAGRETDRQFIEADAETKPEKRESMGIAKPPRFRLLVGVIGEEHVAAKDNKQRSAIGTRNFSVAKGNLSQ